MWKSSLFSGKLALLTRHLRPIRSQSDIAHCSVMASPSPLDRCWMLNEASATLPTTLAVRTAVERHWPDLQRSVASVLGDESLAAEIMEGAIEEAVAYLADHPPEDRFEKLQEHVLEKYPNPERVGCIDHSTLKTWVYSPEKLDLSDPKYLHV
jgi:hypothetical protein